MVEDGSAVYMASYFHLLNGEKTLDEGSIDKDSNIRTRGRRGGSVCSGSLNGEQTALRYMVTCDVTVRRKVYTYV